MAKKNINIKKRIFKKPKKHPLKIKTENIELCRLFNLTDICSFNTYTKKELPPFLKNIQVKWMDHNFFKSKNITDKFTLKILEFVKKNQPNEANINVRYEIIKKLNNAVKNILPGYKLFTFGSYFQGLSISNSDLDFEIIQIKQNDEKDSSKIIYYDNINEYNKNFQFFRDKEISELNCLYIILLSEKLFEDINIVHAKDVPILKCTDKNNNIDIDISINRINGYINSKLLQNILNKHLPMIPIIIFIKLLLLKHNLNKVRKGGMSSILLFHIVYYYYLKYKKDQNNNIFISNEIEINKIGDIIKGFLFFYGCEFKNMDEGLEIDVKHETITTFKKFERDQNAQKLGLFMIDIFNNKNNIGKKCFNYKDVRTLFQNTYNIIKNQKNIDYLIIENL